MTVPLRTFQTRPAQCALILSALLVLSLEGRQQPQPRPTFRTEANFVRVDVFPTPDGVPVADLSAADFELLEDGVAQRSKRSSTSSSDRLERRRRVEPDSQRQANQMAQDPRARVFVIFLDTYHVVGPWLAQH